MPPAGLAALGSADLFIGDLSSHLFSINPNPEAPQFDDDGSASMPYLTLDYACGHCHNGEYATVKTVEFRADGTYTKTIHGFFKASGKSMVNTHQYRVLEATAWFQQTETENLDGDDSAWGIGVAMPNSEGWNGEIGQKVLERNYFPALGFASRTDIAATEAELGYIWRPQAHWIRRVESGVEGEFVNAIDGRDQAREIQLLLAEIENQSADAIAFEQVFVEERFAEPFEISEGVIIPAGDYRFDHGCVTFATGQQRDLATETGICDGDFYDGQIFVFETTTTWRPSKHLRVILGAEYNDVELPQGDFITRLADGYATQIGERGQRLAPPLLPRRHLASEPGQCRRGQPAVQLDPPHPPRHERRPAPRGYRSASRTDRTCVRKAWPATPGPVDRPRKGRWP